MKRLLIISSEPLHPKNLLSSIFELTQAKALQELYEVTILSVRNGESSIVLLKKNINQLLKFKVDFGLASHFFYSILFFFRVKRVLKHTIEGVSVYESIYYTPNVVKDFREELDYWIAAGHNAFVQYTKEHGIPFAVHAHGRFLSAGILACRIKETHHMPFVYTEHSTYYQLGKAPREAVELLSVVVEQASFFIAVSPSLLSQVESFIDRTILRAVIIPNVLDRVFEESLLVKEERGFFEFLSIGSLETKKGFDVLIKAFAIQFKGKDVRLRIVGEGPDFDELNSLVSELKLNEQVTFVGNQNKVMVRRLMDEADAFVLASRIETFGVVVIEALARGLPVVCTRSGGPEFIVLKENGLIVESENLPELAHAMGEMRLNAKQYNRNQIQLYAIENFGAESFRTKMKSLYQLI